MNNEAAYFDDFLTVGAASIGFRIPADTRPVRGYVTVETAAIRFRFEGNKANGGIGGGHLANAGDEFTVEGVDNIKNFQMAADTATSAKVYYTLEKL